jgi:hypothetical protein
MRVMQNFPISLLFISVILEESLSHKLGLNSQTSLALSFSTFLIALILLFRVKNRDDVSLQEIIYSEEFKARSLIKYMCYWFAIALLIDVVIAGLLEDQFWSNINPFDSSCLFLILLFVSVFSSGLKVEFSTDKSKVKCSRLGFITSRITNFKSVNVSGNELIIISQDNGKFTFKLDRFTKPMRESLVGTCLNMPNK